MSSPELPYISRTHYQKAVTSINDEGSYDRNFVYGSSCFTLKSNLPDFFTTEGKQLGYLSRIEF